MSLTTEKAKRWVLPYGKYKGLEITQVKYEDEGYLEWLHGQLDDDNILKKAIELACWTNEFGEVCVDKILELQNKKVKK